MAGVRESGLKLIVDIVPNHCSSEHPLFRAALAAGPGSTERARFHFADGRGPDGGEPPNNWPSVFGGPAWTRVTEADGRPGQWFLHLYAPEQPDWNWRNPATGDFFAGVLRFWFDRGVDGLRVDVAHGLFKAEGLPDLDDPATVTPMRLRGNPLACDQPEVHDVYQRWRTIADGYDPPRALIGEVNLEPERAARYVRPDELHQAFAFALVAAPWDAQQWADVGHRLLNSTARPSTASKASTASKTSGVDRASGTGRAPVTWVVENHDVVRAPSRYGSPGRARAALLAILGLPGAAYIYQGQELGLPEVEVPPEWRQDPAWARSGISRDGCRVPFPWQRDPAGTYGFSPAGAGPSWLPVPPGWGSYAGPPPAFFLEAMRLRATLLASGEWSADDGVTWSVGENGLLLAVRASVFALAVAMGDVAAELPPGRVLVGSGPLTAGGLLPPDTAVWLALG